MVKDKAAADAAEKPSSPTKAAAAAASRSTTRSSPRKKSKSNKQPSPPTIIITLDKNNKSNNEEEEDNTVERRDADATTTSFVQANTPKHANKQQQSSSSTRDEPPTTSNTQQHLLQAQFAPPGAAYAPHAGPQFQQQQQQRLYPVSPAGAIFQPYQGRGALPPDYFGGQQQQYRGPFPPPGAAAAFVPGRGPNFPMQQFVGTNNQAYQTMAGSFSRAVSNSFDRQQQDARMPPQNAAAFFPNHERKDSLDAGASMDDDSWKQLKQVTSVDEDMMRARLTKTGGHTTPIDKEKEIASASSSLTNSPVGDNVKEETDNNKPTTTTTAQSSSRRASLDSLSSVASAKEKLQTKDGRPAAVGERLSPGSASAAESLDLMRCHSGSSALLQGFPGGHQREGSLTSVHIPTDNAVAKRPLDGAAEQQPDPKRGKKSSPLSVVCSPPKSPSNTDDDNNKSKQQQDKPTPSQVQAVTASPGLGSHFQHPTYTYTVDSHGDPRAGFPPLPARPSSLSSSSTTPGVERHTNPGLGQSLPSWDIHGQDSFGGASAGGGAPIMPNFSFGAAQEYPMLTASGSNIGFSDSKLGLFQGGGGLQGLPMGMHPSITETRNQSFEGGHYHGSFDMGYPQGMLPQGGPPGPYRGPFPPHAPSWGSATSGFQGGHPVGAGPRVRFADDPRLPPGVMMRNFSMEDGRTSPPGPPPGFMPPPSEFSAPPNQSLGRRVPPVPVYLMSNARPPISQMDANMIAKQNPGIYGWSKEDDDRLTEVMKKFKNPRTWEPVAKELGRGKTAKECHERWIRYLKPGVRKGQWTDHEDAIVVEAVTTSTEQPFTRWSDLAQRLPGRVGKQIRDRWVNHLNPNINHLPFSKEDDKLLWEGHKVCGKKWVEISTRFFNSSRSENHIKNRWYSASFKKFITSEYGPDVYDVATKGKSPKGKKSAKE